MENYTAYFDAGYYPNKQECILAYTIEKDDVICDFGIKILPFIMKGIGSSEFSKYIETFSLKFLLEKINLSYKNCMVNIYGDCRDVIKNIEYGNGSGKHKNIGDIIDSFRHLYDKQFITITWISRSKNSVVDYLTQYHKIHDNILFKNHILSQDNYQTSVDVNAKLLYIGNFYKTNICYQLHLYEDKNGEFYVSIRDNEHHSSFNIIKTKDEINTLIDKLSDNCYQIKFNHRVFNNGEIFKYINNTYLELK